MPRRVPDVIDRLADPLSLSLSLALFSLFRKSSRLKLEKAHSLLLWGECFIDTTSFKCTSNQPVGSIIVKVQSSKFEFCVVTMVEFIVTFNLLPTSEPTNHVRVIDSLKSIHNVPNKLIFLKDG
jgi:hypothetical protein